MEWSEQRITDTILTLSLMLAEERERRDRTETQLASALSEIGRLRTPTSGDGVEADDTPLDPSGSGGA